MQSPRRGVIIALVGVEDPKFVGKLSMATGSLVFTFSSPLGKTRTNILANALERMQRRDLMLKKSVDEGRNLILVNYVPESLMAAETKGEEDWVEVVHQSLPKPDLILAVGKMPSKAISGMVTLVDNGHDDVFERAVTVVKSVFVLGTDLTYY